MIQKAARPGVRVGITALLAELYDSVESPESVTSFLKSLEQQVPGVNNVSWCVSDHLNGELDFQVGSAGPEVLREYASRLDEDARMDAVRNLPPGRHVLHGEAVVSPVEFRRSALFRDVLLPADLIDAIAGIGLGTDHSAFLILNRGRRSRRFDGTAERLLRILLPHLQRAVRLSLCARSANIDFNAPTVQVGPDGRIVSVNDSARRHLCRHGALVIRHGRLRATDDRTDRALKCSIRLMTSRNPTGGAGEREFIRVSALRGSILLWILPRIQVRPDLSRERTALVVVLDPDAVAEAHCPDLEQLTAAESELLRALVSGQTLRDYAAARQRSVHTVRTQLKSIFQKTGAASQTDLVRRFLYVVH